MAQVGVDRRACQQWQTDSFGTACGLHWSDVAEQKSAQTNQMKELRAGP